MVQQDLRFIISTTTTTTAPTKISIPSSRFLSLHPYNSSDIMHAFSIAATAIAFAASALASPVAEPVSLNTRAASKLNQYSNPDCKDNSGGNTPTYHASPPARKCYNIDPTTVSFYWGQGPLTQVWAYSKAGCTGLSTNLVGGSNCVAVNINKSDEFKNVLSIMID